MKKSLKKIILTGLAFSALTLNIKSATAGASTLAAKNIITEDSAKDAALKDAGLSGKTVHYTNVEIEHDDGRTLYDIDFMIDGTKYSYEIDANDGSVISKEVKNAPKRKKKVAKKKSNYIGTKKAKSIALKHAKVSAKSATFESVHLDKENGIYVYEVSFYTSEKEYDYEINAKTGKIISHSSEYHDNDDND